MLESAFTPKVRSKFCKRDRYEGPQSCTSLRRSWHLKESCGLSQTFIAVILVWCDNHVPDMRNISKTGQLHPCIGSKTNWPRANCWSCTLQHFIWPWQEWNKMDLSSFHCHCSWLALLALSKGCVPSCFHHMCHELTFSVSPTDDGLCSCQQASFEVHLRQVDTKPASYQRRFQFQAHLFDHPDLLRGFQDRAEAHELMQNWQKQHFTGPQLKASLPLEDLCIFLFLLHRTLTIRNEATVKAVGFQIPNGMHRKYFCMSSSVFCNRIHIARERLVCTGRKLWN